MDGKKKIWATAVLCAVASVGFVVSAGAEETMTHDLDEVIVEADRNTLPGGFVANNDRVGILGNIKAIDVPFTQKKYTEKTIMTFYDPNQPLNGTLANTPSIRIGSTSPMYTDFSMRGVNMNASHYYINGIPNMFNQTRSIPAYILSSVDIVSGPNTVLNGATFSNNGTNGTDAPAGLLNGTTKRAAADPVTRYTQRFSGRSTWTEDLDLGRRFGKNNEWGIRVNAHNEDGGLSIKGADIRDKSIYINLDHQDAKSMTNIFGGYYDWKVNGGQRWLSASGVTKGNLAEAPNGKTDLSFDGQTKYNHGMLFTLNHIQKFSDKWSGFINGGYGHYSEHKNDPNSGSLTLGDNGKLSGKFRDYVSDSKSSYWQVGVSNKAAIGNVKKTCLLPLIISCIKVKPSIPAVLQVRPLSAVICGMAFILSALQSLLLTSILLATAKNMLMQQPWPTVLNLAKLRYMQHCNTAIQKLKVLPAPKSAKIPLILPLLSLISLSKIYQYMPATPNPIPNR